MAVPLFLLIGAIGLAAGVAYGTHPWWAQHAQGLEIILLSRRLQWPMAVLSLGLCLALVGLIVSGRRRAWWLIGLGPVLALFMYRFSTGPANEFIVLENPPFVSAQAADFMHDDDFVVGVVFEGQAYAFPYQTLYVAPVVGLQDHDRRMVLMWSAFANRVLAFEAGRALRVRDLEIVSMPGNALLLYNNRRGQFINGFTGLTTDGHRPEGLGEAIKTRKMRWHQWQAMQERTLVLAPIETGLELLPAGPILPYYGSPQAMSVEHLPYDARVTLLATDPPLAVPSDRIASQPLNLSAGGVPVLLWRDAQTGQVQAFDRRIEADLSPRFRQNTDRRRPRASLVDTDTGAGWSLEGVVVDGDPSLRGRRLKRILFDDDVYWGVVKHWYPEVHLVTDF